MGPRSRCTARRGVFLSSRTKLRLMNAEKYPVLRHVVRRREGLRSPGFLFLQCCHGSYDWALQSDTVNPLIGAMGRGEEECGMRGPVDEVPYRCYPWPSCPASRNHASLLLSVCVLSVSRRAFLGFPLNLSLCPLPFNIPPAGEDGVPCRYERWCEPALVSASRCREGVAFPTP